MMMSGKSALRKKRFTVGRRRVAPSIFGTYAPDPAPPLRADCASSAISYVEPQLTPEKLGRRRDQVSVEHRDVRQVAIALGEVEAVSDHEAIRDLEADVAHGDVDLSALRLRQEGPDLA